MVTMFLVCFGANLGANLGQTSLSTSRGDHNKSEGAHEKLTNTSRGPHRKSEGGHKKLTITSSARSEMKHWKQDSHRVSLVVFPPFSRFSYVSGLTWGLTWGLTVQLMYKDVRMPILLWAVHVGLTLSLRVGTGN